MKYFQFSLFCRQRKALATLCRKSKSDSQKERDREEQERDIEDGKSTEHLNNKETATET